MILISTTHDPDRSFIPLLEQVKDKLAPYLHNAIMAPSPTTHPDTIKKMEELGFTIVTGGSFNQGRVASLKKALELNPDEQVFISVCLDKIIHWLLYYGEAFDALFKMSTSHDIELLGRTEVAWATYPESWSRTETIVNDLFSRKIGQKVDALTGDLIITRRAAELVIEKSVEIWAGGCIEWPLLALQAGYTVGCTFTDGFSWEDADRSQAAIEAAGGLNEWKESLYEGLSEWKKRSQFQVDMISAMQKF